MPKQKPKRIRTRPGKTPAHQINWTEEEVSNIDLVVILFYLTSAPQKVMLAVSLLQNQVS